MFKKLRDNYRIKKNVNKCPSCGCEELTTSNFVFDDPYNPFVEETWTKCKKCGRFKHHWAYGFLYVSDWKDTATPSFFNRIVYEIKTKLHKKHDDKNDLPF